MLFSRAPGERAYYQYNEWTDRPTLRVAQLLLERLDARRAFTGVTQIGGGVAGDVLVNLVVDDLVHDLSPGGAGVGRLTVAVEIVDRRQRRLLARRTFVESSPAQAANAGAAAAAMNRALTAFLDAASAWIESVVETAGN
jgi:cholesterol transport system auxiliary component